MPETVVQVGTIPYFFDGGKLRFVLITPKNTQNIWIMPKGNIEPDLGPEKSAILEAMEEAGLDGTLASVPCGSYTYTKDNRSYEVNMYPFEVSRILKNWHESGMRSRRLAKRKSAVSLIFNQTLAQLVNDLGKKLKAGSQD